MYYPDIDGSYHSTKGALSESEYVFIRQGPGYFDTHCNADPVRMLEGCLLSEECGICPDVCIEEM